MKKKGFTLIELMIVVAIIAIIAAIAIPSLLRSRITSNETSAIATLRTVVTAQAQYKTSDASNEYGTLSELSNTTPPYIDSVVAGGKKSGYCFVLTRGTPADSNYEVTADPTTVGKTGNRRFFVNSGGVIRFDSNTQADSNDSPIDG